MLIMRKPNLPEYDKILTLSYLEEQYIENLLNPYEIAELIKCDHKTVRAYLKKHNIQLRTRSEYNSLARKTYTEPTDDLLYSPLSILFHRMYDCEGSTYKNVMSLSFCNQDPQLIFAFCNGLKKIYKYESEIKILIRYNKLSESSLKKVKIYEDLISNQYPIIYQYAEMYKNPILVVSAGGRRLVELVVKNIQLLKSQ